MHEYESLADCPEYPTMKVLPGRLPNENEMRNGNIVLREIPLYGLFLSVCEESTEGIQWRVEKIASIDRIFKTDLILDWKLGSAV